MSAATNEERQDMDYRDFLIGKAERLEESGFHVERDDLNQRMFPFQLDITQWALKQGRCAIFAECGLGKTVIQLDWAKLVAEHTGLPVLILAPLAVSQQTKREGAKFGIPVTICKDQSEIASGVNVTNYERLERFDPAAFGGVVLDESSILKAFAGKIKRALCSSFAGTPYRLCCTATPAPNDHMELGNHSEFLGVMPSNEMLSRWFINDTMNFGTYRLKHHAIGPFWQWVSSWAVCVRKPSDLGHNDNGFILPELHQFKHVIRADYDKLGVAVGDMFYDPTTSATSVHKVMRATAPDRALKVAEIVAASIGPFVIWCHTNYEADALKAALETYEIVGGGELGFVEVRGNDKPEVKEKRLLGFTNGDFRILITKPSIAGYGLNWQHCRQMAFVGLSYSYESYYQAVRREWRFGQQHEVDVHLVMTDAEQQIFDTVMNKAAAHDEMTRNMYENFQFGLTGERGLALDYDRKHVKGKNWEMIMGDCVDETKTLESDSVDFTIFSPPFSSLYIYSDSARDMGNCKDDTAFFEHFDLLIPELLRVTRPGRLIAVHCKNLVYYKGDRGSSGLRDFRGEIIRVFTEAGFDYHSEVTIWKDPVIEMQRTKSHGLLHKQLCKDSTFSRQGLPDYLVIFRKWAKSEDQEELVSPVRHETDRARFDHYVGENDPSGEDSIAIVNFSDFVVLDDKNDPTGKGRLRGYSIKVWQRYASPVWFDIRQTNVLNVQAARQDEDEKHICPLQLDVIERAVHLWTNPGDLVFSPFAGIGSEGYGALKQGRRFIGIELKESYFNRACINLKQAVSTGDQLDLIDAISEVENGE